DRPHRVFLVTRHAKLSHNEHVERRAELAGELEGDRHAAPRQAEHHHVGLTAVDRKELHEVAAGTSTVRIDHGDPVSRWLANHRAASRATSSSVPGSSNRCDAPRTIASSFVARRWA